MKKILMLVGALSAVVALSSCSKAPSRDDVKAQVEKAGVTGATADCVTDKMIAKFGSETLGANREPTAEETSAITVILTECMTSSTTTPS